jgi:hypothetical protein
MLPSHLDHLIIAIHLVSMDHEVLVDKNNAYPYYTCLSRNMRVNYWQLYTIVTYPR